MYNYYRTIFKDLDIDEMLKFTLPEVFDNVTDSNGRLPEPDQPR